MKSIMEYDTHILVDPPTDVIITESHMAFSNKLKPDGTLERGERLD